MDPSSLTPVMRILRGCLHQLLAALLVLAVVRAVVSGAPDVVAIIVIAVGLGGVYAAGAMSPRVRRSRPAAAGWLLVVGLLWLALLVFSPEAVYLAFPLFFLQLHLLPVRRGLGAVAATTIAAIAGVAWHQGGLAVGAIIGPTLGATVAVAV
ncbi:MAG: sensor histidine kinase, partial [Mycobacteriaceae bacterium]